MPETREGKLEVVNIMIEALESVEATEILPLQGSGDEADDLDDTELDLLINQLYSKTRRVRRKIGTI